MFFYNCSVNERRSDEDGDVAGPGHDFRAPTCPTGPGREDADHTGPGSDAVIALAAIRAS